MHVYQKLLAKVEELPIELLAEIVRLSEPFDWQGAYPFQQVLRKKSRQPVQAQAWRRRFLRDHYLKNWWNTLHP